MVPQLKCDFSGWATRNDLKCADGRIIKQNAFAQQDGEIVPLMWGHMHDDPENVLGHALLKNYPEGVYAYGFLNNNVKAQEARELLAHGDIKRMSIWAGELQHRVNEVVHGVIKEVSLVVGGANPGAVIENVYLAHSDHDIGDVLEDEAIMFFDEDLELYHDDRADDHLEHADEPGKKEDSEMADTDKKEKKENKEKTLEDVYNTLNEDQKTLLHALVGEALAQGEADDDEDGDEVQHSYGGETEMKYNTFDTNMERAAGNVLTHSDEMAILEMAKDRGVGSFQSALQIYSEQHELQHDDTPVSVSGFYQTGQTYNVDALFPEYKEVRPGAPELVTNDQGWITTVINKVHKSPISRIRTSHVDIRNLDSLRAKGYKKGQRKEITGNIPLARRTTDPQTIYVKNQLHKDDITDITDFDYVQYLYNIDKMMLNEELATAIMIGDGRAIDDDYKISPEHIRPIWLDDDLYTIHADLNLTDSVLQGSETESYFGENYILAESLIETVLYARERYKGTGTPDFFMTPHMLNVMLLARDRNGRRIYSSKNELAAALNVGSIVTAEQFAGKTRTAVVDGVEKTKKLHGIICNLADYSLGHTRGGEISHFTQFDIDFNLQKSLLEGRFSGALTKLWSAIAIEEEVTA